jgi:hypothetical protein
MSQLFAANISTIVGIAGLFYESKKSKNAATPCAPALPQRPDYRHLRPQSRQNIADNGARPATGLASSARRTQT